MTDIITGVLLLGGFGVLFFTFREKGSLLGKVVFESKGGFGVPAFKISAFALLLIFSFCMIGVGSSPVWSPIINTSGSPVADTSEEVLAGLRKAEEMLGQQKLIREVESTLSSDTTKPPVVMVAPAPRSATGYKVKIHASYGDHDRKNIKIFSGEKFTIYRQAGGGPQSLGLCPLAAPASLPRPNRAALHRRGRRPPNHT